MSELIDIDVQDGAMTTVLARPDGAPRGAVVVLMEAFGVNDHIAEVATRFAAEGYLALAPDLYHRSGRLLTAAYDDLGTAMELFGALETERMASDLCAALRTARQRVPGAPVTVVGFCLGGYASVLAAVVDRPDLVAGFYGAGLSKPREGSPLTPLADRFDAISCPVLLFYGAEDPVIPPTEIEATEQALTSADVEHSITVYRGAGHGFFCDARPSYVGDAAGDAWTKLLDALARTVERVS